MEIDAVEPAVRAAFEASVEEDPDRFHEAIEDILDRGDDFTIEAFQLAINVTAIVLQDMHDGEVPGAQEISDLAEDFAQTQEDWSEVSADLARTYMASAMGEEAVLDVMSPGDVAVTGFALGGWLLSAFLPEDKDWSTYLDEVLKALEAALAEE